MTPQEKQLRDLISRCKNVQIDSENAQLFIDDFNTYQAEWDSTRENDYKYNVSIQPLF